MFVAFHLQAPVVQLPVINTVDKELVISATLDSITLRFTGTHPNASNIHVVVAGGKDGEWGHLHPVKTDEGTWSVPWNFKAGRWAIGVNAAIGTANDTSPQRYSTTRTIVIDEDIVPPLVISHESYSRLDRTMPFALTAIEGSVHSTIAARRKGATMDLNVRFHELTVEHLHLFLIDEQLQSIMHVHPQALTAENAFEKAVQDVVGRWWVAVQGMAERHMVTGSFGINV
ncbi:hypothetical protein HKX48_008471 [Thoreauomyces humboldtii]|nr:hypothetical protein HKX48_008471 [Thoreauomyces humboldtii]